MTRRILIVGDHLALEEEYNSSFIAADCTWTAEFARTGAEAIAWVSRSIFDAVFTNVSLPDTTGVEVLDKIALLQPKALRIIQSLIGDTGDTLNCLGRAHHHIAGPCDLAKISSLLHQALTMESWLPSETVQGLLAKLPLVPSPPSVYFQIVDKLESPDTSVEDVANVIAQDPAITAKLLQLANSAAFGLQSPVSNPVDAVSYVGMETTQALVLLAHTFASFDQRQFGDFSIEALWQHSVWTGHFARRIALTEGHDPELVAQAFVAGLLHDIGKLLFAANLPKDFAAALKMARSQSRALWEVEAQILGANHAEVGGCLLGIWGLPAPIVDAVAYHHFPIRLLTQAFSPLTATFAANIFEHSVRQDEATSEEIALDPEYLKNVGLGERVEEWQQSCLAEP
ncbi:MAG TPA: response regulator [Candidatus Paceibacterota bacterium]|nr:response regulator [Candidatus Paceibacterota bacterium]